MGAAHPVWMSDEERATNLKVGSGKLWEVPQSPNLAATAPFLPPPKTLVVSRHAIGTPCGGVRASYLCPLRWCEKRKNPPPGLRGARLS